MSSSSFDTKKNDISGWVPQNWDNAFSYSKSIVRATPSFVTRIAVPAVIGTGIIYYFLTNTSEKSNFEIHNANHSFTIANHNTETPIETVSSTALALLQDTPLLAVTGFQVAAAFRGILGVGALVNRPPQIYRQQKGFVDLETLSNSELQQTACDPELRESTPRTEDETMPNQQPMGSLIPDCFSAKNCPDLQIKEVHPQMQNKGASLWFQQASPLTQNWLILRTVLGFTTEETLKEEMDSKVVQELYRFRKDGFEKKILFVETAGDEIFDKPEWRRTLSETFLALSNTHDIKYGVVNKGKYVCQAVKNGAQTGILTDVYLMAHGDPTSIKWGEGSFMDNRMNFSKCFSGLHPEGKIYLISCSTGKGFYSLAQRIADTAQRAVVAPREKIDSVSITFPNLKDPYYPYIVIRGNKMYSVKDGKEIQTVEQLNAQENSFKTFFPRKKQYAFTR